MISKNVGWRGDSQLLAPTVRQVLEGLISETVQSSVLCVPFELLVPRLGVELVKP